MEILSKLWILIGILAAIIVIAILVFVLIVIINSITKTLNNKTQKHYRYNRKSNNKYSKH